MNTDAHARYLDLWDDPNDADEFDMMTRLHLPAGAPACAHAVADGEEPTDEYWTWLTAVAAAGPPAR